jgi:hypothetical protein
MTPNATQQRSAVPTDVREIRRRATGPHRSAVPLLYTDVLWPSAGQWRGRRSRRTRSRRTAPKYGNENGKRVLGRRAEPADGFDCRHGPHVRHNRASAVVIAFLAFLAAPAACQNCGTLDDGPCHGRRRNAASAEQNPCPARPVRSISPLRPWTRWITLDALCPRRRLSFSPRAMRLIHLSMALLGAVVALPALGAAGQVTAANLTACGVGFLFFSCLPRAC